MSILSVIIPVYNVAPYLERCLKSIIYQELKDIEIIIVNDGSTDTSGKICDKYAEKDSRIKVIHKANEGLGFARNTGLEYITGEFVAFVDSDDYVDKDTYKVAIEEAKKENADVVYFGCYRQRRDLTFYKETIPQKRVWNNDNKEEYLFDIVSSAPNEKVERKYSMSVWHSVYKSEIVKKNNLCFLSERDIVSEDIPFQIDFLKKANVIVFIPNCFYYYCYNNTSLTKSFKQEKYQRFRLLHSVLSRKYTDNFLFLQRVDRFFIGYTRNHLLDMISANYHPRSKVLCEILDDPIWQDIKKRYKAKWLPLYPRIVLYLIFNKKARLLVLFMEIIEHIKRR